MKIQPEWIEWKGGECPIHHSKHVAVTKRNGDVRNGYGDSFDWEWDRDGDGPYDIIAYCPLDIEPYKPKPKWTMREGLFHGGVRVGYVMYQGLEQFFIQPASAAIAIADALNAAGVEL